MVVHHIGLMMKLSHTIVEVFHHINISNSGGGWTRLIIIILMFIISIIIITIILIISMIIIILIFSIVIIILIISIVIINEQLRWRVDSAFPVEEHNVYYERVGQGEVCLT